MSSAVKEILSGLQREEFWSGETTDEEFFEKLASSLLDPEQYGCSKRSVMESLKKCIASGRTSERAFKRAAVKGEAEFLQRLRDEHVVPAVAEALSEIFSEDAEKKLAAVQKQLEESREALNFLRCFRTKEAANATLETDIHMYPPLQVPLEDDVTPTGERKMQALSSSSTEKEAEERADKLRKELLTMSLENEAVERADKFLAIVQALSRSSTQQEAEERANKLRKELVTMSLVQAAQRLVEKRLLVKNLEALETLGSSTVIVCDKTGTLTQNCMGVQHCWYDLSIFRTPAAKNAPNLKELLEDKTNPEPCYDPNDATFKKLFMVGTLCSNAYFLEIDEEVWNDGIPTNAHYMRTGELDGITLVFNMRTGEPLNVKEDTQDKLNNLLEWKCKGDQSEEAILKFCQPISDQETYRRNYPSLVEIQFSSTNKFQLSIHKQPGSPKSLLVLKGAPERVLAKCKYIMIKGEKVPLTRELQDQCVKANETLGGYGERVLGCAYSELDEAMFPEGYAYTCHNCPVDDLTYVGLFSLIDPPREGVPEAVAKCKHAGVKFIMVTGDHPVTAQAIAKQVGILDQSAFEASSGQRSGSAGKGRVITGDELRQWQEIDDIAERTQMWDQALSYEQIVFARVSAAQKLAIVENLQRLGHVVAVAGDGQNDAPALRKADIGVAMGLSISAYSGVTWAHRNTNVLAQIISGNDLCKEHSDMLLLDDNFASIVDGMEEGRLIFDNLEKSMCHTLLCSAATGSCSALLQ